MSKGITCAAATFFAAISLGQGATIHDGLLSYWSLDGDASDTAATLAGNASTVDDHGTFDGQNGTGGISFNTGKFGSGIVQDGAAGAAQNNGFVRVQSSADTLAGGENLSVSAWLRVDGYDTNWQTLISHGEGAQYRIARQGAGEGIAYAGGASDLPSPSPIGLNDGMWHHVVATTTNGGGVEVFLDGSSYAIGSGPAMLTNNGNNGAPGGASPDFYIGANPQTGDQNREWFGGIDDVAVWGRVLGAVEVAEIYQAGLAGIALGQIPEPGVSALIGMMGVALLFRRRF